MTPLRIAGAAIKHYAPHGGNTFDSQYLANAFDNIGKPYQFKTMMKIFSAKNRFFPSMQKLITQQLGKQAVSKFEIDTEIYRWDLMNAQEKFARIVENIESTNLTAGINNTSFRIKIDADYYREPDVLMGEDNEYALEIIGEGTPDGIGTIYEVRLQGDSTTQYFPQYLMEPGREFSKVWTSVASEYNDKYGTQQYGGYFKLEGQVGFFGQEMVVSDKAWREDGRIEFKFAYEDINGETKFLNKFLPMAEAKMHDELMLSMEAQLMYGKKQTRSGSKGYWIKTGSGLREQLKDGWVQYYSGALTTTMLTDYLLNIFFARKDENERKVTLMTGTMGYVMFHKMLAAESRSLLTLDTNWIQKNGTHAGTPALSYGAQFTRYNGINGISVDLIANPMYDDRTYCKRTHPAYPGRPIDSFRMTILDFGGYNGDSNIKLLSVKDTYKNFYVPGSHTPYGPVTSGQAVSAVSGYSLHTSGSAGIVMHDVSRGGELIFDILD